MLARKRRSRRCGAIPRLCFGLALLLWVALTGVLARSPEVEPPAGSTSEWEALRYATEGQSSSAALDAVAPLQIPVVREAGSGGLVCRQAAALFPPTAAPSSPSAPGRTIRFATAYSTFEVTYQGFSAEAEEAFQRAIEVWAQYVKSPMPIRVDARFVRLGSNGVAAYAYPTGFFWLWNANKIDKALYGSALWDKIVGFDRAPGWPDITARFNSDSDLWDRCYFGLDGNVPPEMLEFVTLAMHEIGHGLGFVASLREENGKARWGHEANPPQPEGVLPFIFDYCVQQDSRSLLAGYANNSVELLKALSSGRIFHNCQYSREGNLGRPVPLHSPSAFASGTAGHLDNVYYSGTDPNGLMTAFLEPGESLHDPGPATLGILRDMGWTMLEYLYFAQFADGSGISSEVSVTNPSTHEIVTGELVLFDQDGKRIDPATVLSDSSDTSFTIQPLGTWTLKTSGEGEIQQGSALVSADKPVSGIVRFLIPGTGVAGVGAGRPSSSIVLPVRRAGNLSTGAAIRNVSLHPIEVILTLWDQSGALQGSARQIIPAEGRISRFIEQYFPEIETGSFSGTLAVEATTGKIAAIGLELEVGSKFTTLPVRDIR